MEREAAKCKPCPSFRPIMDPHKTTSRSSGKSGPAPEDEILAEQARQVYALSPYGIIATIVNGLIVAFVLQNVIAPRILAAWLAALFAVTLFRIALVLLYWRAKPRQAAARTWKNLFIAELSVIGVVWGSLALLPFSGLSVAHEVFIAFALGGMSAGAAAAFSTLKEGYLAYTIPAVSPLIIKFFLMGDPVHDAMAAMLSLYCSLLWRISRQHFSASRTSLLLLFERKGMIESLESARRELVGEIGAKLKAEAELRAHQEHLERIVAERTDDLLRVNEQLKARIEERKQAEERLALAQQAGRVGVFDVNLVTGKVFWTRQLEELFGLPPGGFEGSYRGWIGRVHPDDRQWIDAQLQKWKRERRKQAEFEYRAIQADGTVRWMSANARLSYGKNGIPFRMIGTTVDITERKRLEEEITHMAHHDMLTGLPNKRLFQDIVNLEMAQARRNRRRLALLFLDLDRFKEINDTFGHNAGDELLREVSKRIRTEIRKSDVAARIGGDEFNIILPDIVRAEDITRIARKIMDSFKHTFTVAGYHLEITASIGISVYPDDAEDMTILFRYADIAMYHAKELGRNTFQFYNSEINVRSIERMRFETCLRQALARKELLVHYQPQVVVETGRVAAAEALVRWRHPDLGLLDSKAFIPVAESIGVISAIDEWVLKTACAQFKSWMDQRHPPRMVGVNLSSKIFQNRDFVETVSRILDEAGLPPACLEIEITERIAMEDIRRTIMILNELAGRGVGISIDDFGTGYSSLNYLKKLPIHRLKLDQSFVKDVATDPDDRAIIQAVTTMAHKMNISVVAEGVETEDQLSFLSSADCDEAQGFLFGRSLPAEEFKKLVSPG